MALQQSSQLKGKLEALGKESAPKRLDRVCKALENLSDAGFKDCRDLCEVIFNFASVPNEEPKNLVDEVIESSKRNVSHFIIRSEYMLKSKKRTWA